MGALTRRTVGRSTRKTSWGTGIMYVHSYLHKWSTQVNNGFLNVKCQNLEVGKILK